MRNWVLGLRVVCASAVACVVIGSAMAARADGVFQISSPAFGDGAMLPATFAFDAVGTDGTACGGKNQSLPLAWENPPAATKSFAVVLFDPDGMLGTGVAHFVAYNLPPGKTSLAQGEANGTSPGFTIGKNQFGNAVYRGMCPPHGASVHHYVATIYALDLDPSLPAGLTRADLLAAMTKHILGNSSIVGRYQR